ncbi:hypothetical protein B0H14DRAFT_1453877 [Mycena olivaceomarginata]|nr:hypothetical protein B0H14DRAFT_1453877 [Mycena olivaceomarginata]
MSDLQQQSSTNPSSPTSPPTTSPAPTPPPPPTLSSLLPLSRNPCAQTRPATSFVVIGGSSTLGTGGIVGLAVAVPSSASSASSSGSWRLRMARTSNGPSSTRTRTRAQGKTRTACDTGRACTRLRQQGRRALHLPAQHGAIPRRPGRPVRGAAPPAPAHESGAWGPHRDDPNVQQGVIHTAGLCRRRSTRACTARCRRIGAGRRSR